MLNVFVAAFRYAPLLDGAVLPEIVPPDMVNVPLSFQIFMKNPNPSRRGEKGSDDKQMASPQGIEPRTSP